ncbi:hypothetical protein ACFE04_020831 [Oxalis oulophora]
MLSEPSQICIHFLGSRLFGERNPISVDYIPIRFIRAHRDIIPDKIKLHSWEGRVWDVDIERVRTCGLVFGGSGWLALFNFYNIKMGYIVVFDFTNRIDEAKFFLFDQTQCPVPCLPYHPPSPQSADPSPQVLAHPQDSTSASPHPQHSVDMSISGMVKVNVIPFVGQIGSGLTLGKRGYPDEVCINEFWPHLEK